MLLLTLLLCGVFLQFDFNFRSGIVGTPVVYAVENNYQIVFRTHSKGTAWITIDGIEYNETYAGYRKTEENNMKANEKKSFAAFTIGRKVGEDTLYMNCIAFPNQKFKIPFDILAKGNEVFVAGYLRPNKYTKDGKTTYTIQLVVEKIRETDEN